jgi:hypothetical protein
VNVETSAHSQKGLNPNGPCADLRFSFGVEQERTLEKVASVYFRFCRELVLNSDVDNINSLLGRAILLT